MAVYSPENTPEQNMVILGRNHYPGRLLVQGFVGETGVQAYVIEGRRESSRNRVFSIEDGIVSTEVHDKSKDVKPELTIYDAMRRKGDIHVVTNGDQTDTAMKYLRSGMTFEQAMLSRQFEPDEPNYTPRISGFLDMDPTSSEPFGLSLITRDPDNGETVHGYFSKTREELAAADGVGYALQTYEQDALPGEAIPSFREEPFPLPIKEDPEEMANMLWDKLSNVNIVAVVAKSIEADGTITFANDAVHNRY